MPGIPTDVVAKPGDEFAKISWDAPTAHGVAAITGYSVAAPGSAGCSTTGTTQCTIVGLTDNLTYKVTVRALSADGEGPAAASVSVEPGGSPDCSSFGPGADLRGCDLSNLNLDFADLDNADLSGADLSSTALEWSSLKGAILQGADLTGTFLVGTTSGGITGMPSAFGVGWSLSDGFLLGPGISLAGANLSGADLAGGSP